MSSKVSMEENNIAAEIHELNYKENCPLLIVLSGPSGVGKDAVLNRMKKLGYPFHYVVTTTTRHKRIGEKDGVDYKFISQEKFQLLNLPV